MKYVTGIQPHSTTHRFAGPKRLVNLKVDFYRHWYNSNEVMEAQKLSALYLKSRDPVHGYKFTGPAHGAMSKLLLPDQYIVIQLEKHRFPPRGRHNSMYEDRIPLLFPDYYLVGFYLNGVYTRCLFDLVQLNAWMASIQDRLIMLTPQQESRNPLRD